MTIDEKIKHGIDVCKQEKFNTGERKLDEMLLVNREWGYLKGANFLKSEMIADMQKLAEALEKILPEVYCLYLQAYGKRLDRVESSDIVQIKYNRASEEIDAFSAKYKEQK